MYEIAGPVRSWLTAGRDVTIAQVVATVGFSSRDPSAALARCGGNRVGTLGVPVEPPDEPGRYELAVSDADAAGVGLSCGGVATVLVRRAADLPNDLWERLEVREPALLVSEPDGATEVFTPLSVRAAFEHTSPIARLFARGKSATAVVDDRAVVALWPVPTMIVVGDGSIATALGAQAALLGWYWDVIAGADEAVAAARGLHRCDAYVVLSHAREVDGPALAAALASNAGYVGALGSRRTQSARRDWLTERGVAGLERIHGPAGLDIDAHTPAATRVRSPADDLGDDRDRDLGGRVAAPCASAGARSTSPECRHRHPGTSG